MAVGKLYAVLIYAIGTRTKVNVVIYFIDSVYEHLERSLFYSL